jgi:hypothetical protein
MVVGPTHWRRPVQAGGELTSPDGATVGVLGLLAARGDSGEVVGLSISPIVPTGKRPLITLGVVDHELGVGEALASAPSQKSVPATSLITWMSIPRELNVSEIVPGVTEVGMPANPSKTGNTRLLTSSRGEVRFGRLVAYRSAVYVELGGKVVKVEDALRMEFAGGGVGAGDAGGCVFLPSGEPVGIIFAIAGPHVYAAPLSSVFERAGLKRLTLFRACRHNRDALVPAGERAHPINRWSGPTDLELAIARAGLVSKHPVQLSTKASPPLYDALAARLTRPPSTDPGSVAWKQVLADWLLTGVRDWLSARSEYEKSRAFQQIGISNMEDPFPEIVSALATIDVDLPTQAARTAVEMMGRDTLNLDLEERMQLWRLNAEVVAREASPSPALQGAITSGLTRLLRDVDQADMEDVLSEAMGTLLALPASPSSDTVFRQIARLRPNDAPLHIADYLARQIAAKPTTYETVLRARSELVEAVFRLSTTAADMFVRQVAEIVGLAEYSMAPFDRLRARLSLTDADIHRRPPDILATPSRADRLAKLEALTRVVTGIKQKYS